MTDTEYHDSTIDCEIAEQEVLLSYSRLTIYDGRKPKFLKTGRRTCSGQKICGVQDSTGESDWTKCPHLPKGQTLS